MGKHRKGDLLEIILESARECGWNYFFESDPAYHPFTIRFYREEKIIRCRIYIWNLTHGGGQARPDDEYRIQITGVDRFEKEEGEKVLILGWWDEGEVFAGFDYNHHSDDLGYSPSFQIRQEPLRKAYINGLAPYFKGNDEIAVAFRQDFFMDYVEDMEKIHGFGESETDVEILENATENPDNINDEDLNRVTVPERKEIVATVTRKVRDNNFRSRVLTAYSQKCAFCGIQLKLIEAAHVLPVSAEGSPDDTSNGIALCSLHHKAYDNTLVGFDTDYRIVLNEEIIEKLERKNLVDGLDQFRKNLRAMIILPPDVRDRPHVEFVNRANKYRGW